MDFAHSKAKTLLIKYIFHHCSVLPVSNPQTAPISSCNFLNGLLLCKIIKLWLFCTVENVTVLLKVSIVSMLKLSCDTFQHLAAAFFLIFKRVTTFFQGAMGGISVGWVMGIKIDPFYDVFPLLTQNSIFLSCDSFLKGVRLL